MVFNEYETSDSKKAKTFFSQHLKKGCTPRNCDNDSQTVTVDIYADLIV
jgi:hypothetical protein